MEAYQKLGVIALGILGGFAIGFGLCALVKSNENKSIPLKESVDWEIKQETEEQVKKALQKEKEENEYQEWLKKRDALPQGYEGTDVVWAWNANGFQIGWKPDGTVVWHRK